MTERAKIQAVDIWSAQVEIQGQSNIVPNAQMIEIAQSLLKMGIPIEVEVGGFIRMGHSLKSTLLEMSGMSFEEQAKFEKESMKARTFIINPAKETEMAEEKKIEVRKDGKVIAHLTEEEATQRIAKIIGKEQTQDLVGADYDTIVEAATASYWVDPISTDNDHFARYFDICDRSESGKVHYCRR